MNLNFARRFEKSGWQLGLMLGFCLMSLAANAQTRDELVKNDRDRMLDDESWYYDNLDAGIEAAHKSKKPLMVVLRCIP